MIRFLHPALIVVAIYAAYAICAAIITDTDPYLAAAVLGSALVALTVVHDLEHARDRRIAATRADVWARRDREGKQ